MRKVLFNKKNLTGGKPCPERAGLRALQNPSHPKKAER
jgi:hypothetical protein